MKFFTERQWLLKQYTGRWEDNPYNRSRVEAGELPEAYIGRRTLMANDGTGTALLTEGFHFMVDDEEGREIPWHEEFFYIDVMFRNFTSVCVRTKRELYNIEDLENFLSQDCLENGGFWYATDISEQEARENYDFSDFDSWPVF